MVWECLYQGRLLPLFSNEKDWPMPVRLILYLMGLAYCFLGIAIVSDVFMGSIEKITSRKRRVKNPETGRFITVYVWNATVANLSLMALGSSAPEILLSVIEITTNDMLIGDLGAGTIVGSAAFNLMVISAVCVMSIEDGQYRYIKEVPVYVITATFSVMAYLWLVFILIITSPDVCEVWEALVTLVAAPVLIFLAYLADRGYFSKQSPADKKPLQALPDDITPAELAEIEQQIREEHGKSLTPDQVVKFMEAQYCSTRRNKAFYAHQAMQQALKGKKHAESSMAPPDLVVQEVTHTEDVVAQEQNHVVLGFITSRYAFMEHCEFAKVTVIRSGPENCKASVKFKTREGTAGPGTDYEETEGVVEFERGQMEASLAVRIHNDNAYEDDEEFFVDLSDPTCEEGSRHYEAKLGEISTVTMVIIDDDDPGTLRFKDEAIELEETNDSQTLEVEVVRFNGGTGQVKCKYHTENMEAVAGVDYQEAQGEVTFDDAVQTLKIPVVVNATGRYKTTADFCLILTEPSNCQFDKATDGGVEKCICHITIKGKTGEERARVLRKMKSRIERTKVANHMYKQQFVDAIFLSAEGDDGEETDPSIYDYVMHGISMPWALLFALIPPADYCNGWLCFYGALVMIGIVTAIVGDMANLVGCSMGIEAEITAITFVALGTSLPDTFASQMAAKMDPYADNSIGNVTGSNSINVFIGLGLSWSVGALFWAFQSPTEKWRDTFMKLDDGQKENVLSSMGCEGFAHDPLLCGNNAVFIVPAGSIWFNLIVFSVNAFFAIQHLFARRRRFGGELGGPKRGFMGQYFSAAFLIVQWFIYIIASSIFVTVKNNE